MTATQAEGMRTAGTNLIDRTRLSDPAMLTMYLSGFCGYLENGECSVYGTEWQPEACRSGYIFEGVKCKTRRGF